MTQGLYLFNIIWRPSVLKKNNIKDGKQGKRSERKIERLNRKEQEEKHAIDP